MNKAVGEQEFVLGGMTYVLRPAFSTIEEIESNGRSLVEIFEAFQKGKPRVSDSFRVVYAAMKAGMPEGKPVPFSYEAFGELVMKEHGALKLGTITYGIVIHILSQGQNRELAQKKTVTPAGETPTPNTP